MDLICCFLTIIFFTLCLYYIFVCERARSLAFLVDKDFNIIIYALLLHRHEHCSIVVLSVHEWASVPALWAWQVRCFHWNTTVYFGHFRVRGDYVATYRFDVTGRKPVRKALLKIPASVCVCLCMWIKQTVNLRSAPMCALPTSSRFKIEIWHFV